MGDSKTIPDMNESADELVLFTKRLKLRPVGTSDLESVHQLLSLQETDRYNTAGIPENEEKTSEIIHGWVDEYNEQQSFPFLIELKEEEHMIGLITLRLGKPKYKVGEVSYKIHPDDWGKGYATEALKCVIDFAFVDLGLHRIEAGCAVGNSRSVRVLEKAGMQREGRCRQKLPLKTGWSDNYEYAILDTDLGSALRQLSE